MKKSMIGALIASSVVVAGGDIAPVEPIVETPVVEENTWRNEVTIYGWLPTISAVTPLPSSPNAIDAEAILDDLKMVFMGTYSGRNDTWSLFGDVIYFDMGDSKINLTLWDIAGQERWTDMRHVYYQGSSGCIMVYDISRPITFKHIEEYWFPDLGKFCKDEKIPIILIANKIDVPEKLKRVDSFEGNELGGRVNAFRFIETSALTGHNVEEAFTALSKV